MLKVGLTGGIGVGKTYCAEIFDVFDIPIYNSDIEAKKLMITSESLKTDIMESFGLDSYHENGSLNRGYLASIIFKDKNALTKMNALVHPAVRADFISWCDKYKDRSYIIQEAALIFETGNYKSFDKLIVVDAPLDLRIKRVKSRDNATEESIMDRIGKQKPQEEKVASADYVINNDGTVSLLKQVFDIHQNLLSANL